MKTHQWIIDRLHELRQGPTWLSRKCGVSYKTVYCWIRGGHTPGFHHRVAIAKALEMGVADVHARFVDDNPPPAKIDVLPGLLVLPGAEYLHVNAHALYAGGAHPDNQHGLVSASGGEPSAAFDRKEQGSTDVVLIGSPTAENTSRRVFGYVPDGDDSLALDNLPFDLPYRWVLSRNQIDERATSKRLVQDKGVVERPNWRIEGHRMFVPRTDGDGFLQDDYLLVTKLRNYTSQAAVDSGKYLLSLGGTHGLATRGIELLMSNRHVLGDLARKLPDDPAAFQAVFRVGDVEHGPSGSKARKIALAGDPVLLPDTTQVWRTAVQVAERHL